MFKILICLFSILNTTWMESLADSTTNVRFYVEGNGFHRNAMYIIQTNLIQPNCYISLNLEVPNTLYVNVDELANLRRSKKNIICSKGEKDVEKFAEKASSQQVTVCSEIKNELLFSIPIHQRYQYATNGGSYKNISFPIPKLLLGCKNEIAHLKLFQSDLCLPCAELWTKWYYIPYELKNKTYIWQVPVGNALHSKLVTFVTLLTTIIAAIFILRIIRQIEFSEEKKD